MKDQHRNGHSATVVSASAMNSKDSILPTVVHSSNNLSKSSLNAILSCLAYSSCSIMMVLANKYVTISVDSSMRSQIPNIAIVWFQCVFAVILLEISKLLGFVEYPGLEYNQIKSWLPINILFIAMIFTGFMSLVYVSVPMVTIMKNLTNVGTVIGDQYFFGEK